MVVHVGIGRVIRDHQARINSVDFSKDGELLLSSGDDQHVYIYSCQHGTQVQTSQCRKYGVESARFTHDPFSIIAASRNDYDHGIRYLSLHDNRYMRFFKGHTDRVVALEMSPKEDTFASASADDTVRLWDLRTTDCTGVIRFAGGRRAAIAFDLQGMVFAASGGGGQTKMYDVRAYDKGPFATFTPDMGGPIDFSSVKFSHDGKLMLLGTTQGTVPRHVGNQPPRVFGHFALQLVPLAPDQAQGGLQPRPASASLGQLADVCLAGGRPYRPCFARRCCCSTPSRVAWCAPSPATTTRGSCRSSRASAPTPSTYSRVARMEPSGAGARRRARRCLRCRGTLARWARSRSTRRACWLRARAPPSAYGCRSSSSSSSSQRG
jgi:hypothetical protein